MRVLVQIRVEGQPEAQGVQERPPGEKGCYGSHFVELQGLLRAEPAPVLILENVEDFLSDTSDNFEQFKRIFGAIEEGYSRYAVSAPSGQSYTEKNGYVTKPRLSYTILISVSMFPRLST